MSGRGSVGASQVGLQFSVYPLRQEHLHPAIEAAVQAAAREGVDVTVGRLSTFAPGEEDSVFAAVRAAFDAARSFGPAVMVVTLSSGPPSEGTVAEIQGTAADAVPAPRDNRVHDDSSEALPGRSQLSSPSD
jgi:uncharacterized protein YqgV (UPF0045/DUF77 family)